QFLSAPYGGSFLAHNCDKSPRLFVKSKREGACFSLLLPEFWRIRQQITSFFRLSMDIDVNAFFPLLPFKSFGAV
ncbi:MAG: hypothetical protein ACE5PV_22285, partial [Candidatus Poribacteria bacterium]